MITRDNCPPCDAWWAQKDSWESVGWSVVKVSVNGTGVKLTPTFRVFNSGKWSTHTGYMKPNDARRLMGIKEVSAVKLRTPVRSAIATGTYRRGSGEWSYPGDIASHLMGRSHGFSAAQLAGKSKEELERMHSQHHEGQRRPVQAAPTSSPCPGGVCPPSSSYGRGLFGWRR